MGQKLTDLKGEIYTIVGKLSTSSSTVDKTTRPKINMETEDLNNTTNQLGLIDNYETFHSTLGGYTLFSRLYEICSRVDHMLDHEKILTKFKKIESI